MKKILQRLAGTFQIGGGFIGLSQIIPTLVGFNISNLSCVVSAFFLILYLFTLIAGIGLLEDHSKAMSWSLWVQALQIPYISFPFFAYKFVAGFDAHLYWVGMQGGLTYDVGSRWMMSLYGTNVWGIGINLFSLLLFVLLWRVGKGK